MKKISSLFFFFFYLFVACHGAALDQSSFCEQWLNGKCIKGALSKLAESIKQDGPALAMRSSTCDRVCQEACPKCNLCDFCDLCALYNDAACHDVPYFVEDNCAIEKTNSCCKLCEVQCRKSEGVCGSKGFCKNKGEKPGVDLLSRCIAQTTSEECMPCTAPASGH